MIIVMLIALYTTRVVLNVLGVEDYGVYNVVAGFVSLFTVFYSIYMTMLALTFFNQVLCVNIMCKEFPELQRMAIVKKMKDIVPEFRV